MDYSAEISRDHPSCILFLIDQSASMSDAVAGETGRSKAQRCADAINRLLYELSIRCTKDSDGPRNYYDVGVIGYGSRVGPAFAGSLAGRALVPIQELAENPARLDERRQKVEDGAGGLVERTTRIPIWFSAAADNGTPMREAFQRAHGTIETWVNAHPESFPPIVINITDGEANDDPRGAAETLKQLRTNDGNVLLYNLHVSSTPAQSVLYPDSESGLPDEFATQLFLISSVLPQYTRDTMSGEGYRVSDTSRGFVFNSDIVEVISFLDIGTRARNLR